MMEIKTILTCLLSLVALISLLSCFHYSTKINKMKIRLNTKKEYKVNVKKNITKVMNGNSSLSQTCREIKKDVEHEDKRLLAETKLNDIVDDEIDRIEENQRNLKLIKFSKNRFNKF